jgi:hypothetical protein
MGKNGTSRNSNYLENCAAIHTHAYMNEEMFKNVFPLVLWSLEIPLRPSILFGANSTVVLSFLSMEILMTMNILKVLPRKWGVCSGYLH